MASPTTTSILTQFMPYYWDTVLGDNLYQQMYFYQLGEKRMIPKNMGLYIKIPRLKKQNIVGTVTEGTPIAASPICGQTICGTVSQYAGAYKHSDVLIMTGLSDVIELSLRDLARDYAKYVDTKIQASLSHKGAWLDAVGGNAASGGTSLVVKNTAIRPSHVARCVATLDKGNNPRYPDGYFPFVINTVMVYDLQTGLSMLNNWMEVHKYTDNSQLLIGEVGRLFGAKIVATSNMKYCSAGTSGGISAGANSGWESFMFAPRAFYVTEINELTAKTYIKQLGSAGAADPVNQYATVGIKGAFGVVPAAWSTTEYRHVRFYSGSTIAGPTRS